MISCLLGYYPNSGKWKFGLRSGFSSTLSSENVAVFQDVWQMYFKLLSTTCFCLQSKKLASAWLCVARGHFPPTSGYIWALQIHRHMRKAKKSAFIFALWDERCFFSSQMFFNLKVYSAGNHSLFIYFGMDWHRN